MRWTMLLCLLAACGGGDTPDAPDAGPPLEFGGKVFAVVDYQVTALEGVSVELRAAADDAVLATDATDVEGAFVFSVAAAAPLDAYVAVDDGTHLPTRLHPPPLVGGEDLLTVVADAAEIGAWYTQAGDSFDATDRTVIMVVSDAAGDALGDTTIAVDPAPDAFTYYNPDTPAWDPALTTSMNGWALASGAAASLTLTASTADATYPARTIAPGAGELTMIVLVP